MTDTEMDTTALISNARAGDESAMRQLLSRHRDRLRRMVAVHMDIRMAARFDPSDVVQDHRVLPLAAADRLAAVGLLAAASHGHSKAQRAPRATVGFGSAR